MRNNITNAVYNNTGRYKTQPLYQYDYGQKLVISGVDLPSAYEVHFANTVHGNATTQIGDSTGVTIPDMYLTSGQTVYAWLFLHSGESDGETEFIVTIPVIARAKPTDAPPTPVQQSAITEAILALQQALYEAGVTVSHYPIIQNGYWYTWDVDDGVWVNTGVKAEGADGTDGYSPTISVTSITGGHRVSITDANGTHTFDVEDGVSGAEGQDGFSPEVEMEKSGDTVTLSITDKNGTSTVQIKDGANGYDGADGYSPTATVSKSQGTTTITITDKSGTTIAEVSDGQDGQNGSDGTSAYVWIRYAAAQPTQDSDMKTTPDAWIGIYSGDAATAPTAYTAYTWYNIKGATGPVTDVQVNGTSVVTSGVADIPVVNQYGSSNGVIKVAQDGHIKGGLTYTTAITPWKQHVSTFYGLAKAAGDSSQSSSSNAVGTYTEDALSKISDMLNAPVSVSGSTPSITAKAGIRYVCGECSTLSVTVPASGCVDVVFQSGSTATVLTVTSSKTGVTAIKWANGFDDTSLDANTTYEINILDGEYGVACAWT